MQRFSYQTKRNWYELIMLACQRTYTESITCGTLTANTVPCSVLSISIKKDVLYREILHYLFIHDLIAVLVPLIVIKNRTQDIPVTDKYGFRCILAKIKPNDAVITKNTKASLLMQITNTSFHLQVLSFSNWDILPTPKQKCFHRNVLHTISWLCRCHLK